MPNVPYDNFYLSNEIEDQYNSHLNLQQFCTVDDTLTGTAGMVRKIHVYKATDGTEKLAMGEGNSKTIGVHFAEREYRIQLAQNRFHYYDEEAMTDPMIVPVGTAHAGTDMFNTTNADIYKEFLKASMKVSVEKLDFAAFVDAAAKLNVENLEGISLFAFVCPADMAEIRKNLKDDLKYVSEFAKNGYVGTVGGINLYTKKDAVRGTVTVGTKEAVTIFAKKGTEVEQERDANHRGNYVYSRKYYLVALTNETKVVKIVVSGSEANLPMPTDKMTVPTRGDTTYGLHVEDLIAPDVTVTADGKVTGTLKKVEGFTGFSKNKAEQSGHFFPFYVEAPGTMLKVKGKSENTADVVKNPNERMCCVKVDETKQFTISMDDTELFKLDFTGATLAE
ncbi:MAG: hypothetical protein ACLR1M_11040 [Oscillospiraceae bacterium]